MKLPRALLLCSFALAALAGCGSDYEASPIVCDEDDDDIHVIGDTACDPYDSSLSSSNLTSPTTSSITSSYEASPIVCDEDDDDIHVIGDNTCDTYDSSLFSSSNQTSSVTSSNFISQQLTALEGKTWRTICENQQITEMVFSGSQRSLSIEYYTDETCNTEAETPVVTTNATYTTNGYTTESAGRPAVRINFTDTSSNAVSYDIFRVENGNTLYTGVSSGGSSYPTALNDNLPLYAY